MFTKVNWAGTQRCGGKFPRPPFLGFQPLAPHRPARQAPSPVTHLGMLERPATEGAGRGTRGEAPQGLDDTSRPWP